MSPNSHCLLVLTFFMMMMYYLQAIDFQIVLHLEVDSRTH